MGKCPECGEFEFNACSDGLHCRNCGLVLDESPISTNSFISEGIKNRARIPELATAGTFTLNGRYVKEHWFLSTRQKNLFKAKKRLGMISSKLRLQKPVELDAYIIYKTAVEKEINVGRNSRVLLYSCVYASCIMHNVPKTSLEITAFTEIDKNKMLKLFRLLKNKLNLHLEPIDPIDLVGRFGSRLELKQTTISMAVQIITQLKETTVIAGKNPKSIVASALYIASKMNDDYRTQRDFANASGIIEVTLRARVKEMEKA